MTAAQRLDQLREEVDRLLKEHEERERILAAHPQDWRTEAVYRGEPVKVIEIGGKVIEL